MGTLCRSCETSWTEIVPLSQQRCPKCRSPRLLRHHELETLTIAHVDCDAFYATVEKRDNPDIRDKPVIVAHDSNRSVVSTCCYIARLSGVRSAMPLFKAKKLCPDGVIVKPRMAVYKEVSQQIHSYFNQLTPLIEPLSLDEAFLDLTGTENLHHRTAAQSMIWLANKVKSQIGITVSVGLSYNKSLAKLASDLDKPDGFSIIGREEAKSFLKSRLVSDIWGVGKALNRKLASDGITTIGQLQHREKDELIRRYGVMGSRLYHFARGEDDRTVKPNAKAKSISNETTFLTDIDDLEELKTILWPLCEKVSERLKAKEKAGKTITLKLKTKEFQTITRSHTLEQPTQLAENLYQEALPMLEKVTPGRSFRLIGIGISSFGDILDADRPNLLEPQKEKLKNIEGAMDMVRAKFGSAAIKKGRGFNRSPKKED